MPLSLSVVTPEADVLSIDCDEIVAPGVVGDIGFLPGHVPLISALRPGVLTTIKGGKKTYYVVGSGFAEIDDDRVSVLTDSCEDAQRVDAEKARKAQHDAQEKLKNLGPDDPGYGEANRRLVHAKAQLDGASRVDPSARID